ncbi:uncharacterized protein LOC111376856 isoform X2 [Olea europaea var. sylvestris]|uniref:uncharacterized protein LOC111376856 isoform X2 n=1 Tax=Olea europaea var. sylvestris TaxID=158386 RepID=UPI000C1D680C|nr:uncharacterized protein LOC111376856 isoform X2 [Olea europaea var. sylvestris]
MTTVEKLLVQIFERKNGIIEQVKQRTELYNQHLASKLLIEGITPPSWLWNPTQLSDPKELNKEELISELLLPHPRPTAVFSTDRFSLYNNAVTGNHGEISDGLFMEKGFKAQDATMVAAVSNENCVQCAPNGLCELDVTHTSPVDETVERILNVYNAPDQSLARFQRSKSRQKALENRSSAKVQAKNCLSHENGSDVPPSSIRLSISDSKQNDQVREPPKLSEPCNIFRQSCGDWNLDQDNCHSKEKGMNVFTDRTTRSRSSHEVPTFASDSTADAEAGSSCDDTIARKRRSRSVRVSVQDDHVDEFSKLAEPFASSCQGCGGMELDKRDCQNKEKRIDSNTGAHARPMSSGRHQSCVNDFSKTNFSSIDAYKKDGTIVDPIIKLQTDYVNGSVVAISSSDGHTGSCRAQESMSEDGRRHKEKSGNLFCSRITRFSRSGQQNPGIGADQDLPPHSAKADCGMLALSVGSSMEHLNVSNEILGFVKPSVGLVGGVSMSEISSGDKGITEPVNSCNSSSRGDTDYKHHNASSGQIVLHCGETHDVVTLQGNVVANDFVSQDLVGEQSVTSSPIDAKRRRELECLTARAPSDCFMVVKPKQLDFDNMEEHYSNETSTSTSRKIKLDNLPENMCCSSSESELSLDKEFSSNINQLSTHKKSLETSQVSKKGKEDWRGSLESEVNEQFEIQMEKDRSVVSEHPMLMSFENSLGVAVQIANSRMLQKADVFLSNAVPDMEIHQMELHLNQGHESSSDMHIEDGAYNYEGKDKGASGHYASKSQNVRPSFLSNSTNQESGESKDCLIEKVGTAYSTCIIIDEGKKLPLHETQITPCLDNKVSSNHVDNMSCDRRDFDRSPTQGENDGTSDLTCIVLDEKRQLPLREMQIFSFPDIEVPSKYEHNLSSDMRDVDRSLPEGENGLLTCNSAVSLHHEGEILNISSASDPQITKKHSPPERRFRPGEENSWPHIKRRKIEDKQANSFTTSPSFRVRNPYCIELDPTTSCLKNTETKGNAILVDALNEDGNLLEVIESAPKSQNVMGTFYFEKENKHRESSFPINHKQLGASFVLSSTEADAGDTRGWLAKEIRTPFPGDEQSSQHLLPLYSNFDLPNPANLACFEKTLPEGKSHQDEDRLLSQCSVPSPNDKDLNFVDGDQIMPVMEGFVVDAQEDNGKVKIAGDGIDFDKLNLSRTAIERASVLAQICKSASTVTPLSHFSSCFKFQGTQDLFQSVPNGFLERLGNSHLNINVDEQLGFADSAVNGSNGTPYSNCLPYSSARFDWNSGNHYASPVGKLWERLSAHSGNSEKRLSSNPELTCFPIEEDFSISEENKTFDEEADEVQEEIDSLDSSHYAQREPLKDFTNSRLNPPALVSADEMSLSRDSVDFFNTKTSFTGTRNKVKRNSESLLKNNSEAKKNQTLSIGANKVKKDKESFKRSVNKPNLPRRTSVRQEQKLSLKESKRNNIVSNVSSFIPLVQQKKAAAVCAGKRDIKVKALEAAEAAKRLEEKRDNERKARKETLKLERAKMEKENMRQKELDKKKKEEERKTKDADMLAKKRLREEEERKQKEKKRMRVEVKQRQHREQDEQVCAEKAKKEKQRFKHEQVNSNKDSNNDSRRQQTREKAGDDVALKKTETKPVPTEIAMDGVQQTTFNFEESGASCETKKAMDVVHNSCKSDDLFVQSCLEKSYEISPYQCSEDEDEEEDDLPSRKLMPSWASKSSVALVLSLQQEMDPDVIFPHGSFCSMDEVLLPRKLQQI